MKLFKWFAILLILQGQQLYAQSYTLSTGTLDTLIYWGKKGRFCDTLQESNLKAITALQISDRQKGQVITLQGSQLENYRLLVENLKQTVSNEREQGILERAELRQKVKKWRGASFVQGGIIALLLVLLI